MLSDSTIKCKECGNEIPRYLKKCPNCGAVQNSAAEVKRNLFVSFWLWLCVVINSLFTLAVTAFIITAIKHEGMSSELFTTGIIPLVLQVLVLYSYILLLRWKKSGFYILTAIALINTLFNIYLTGINPFSFSSLFGIIILYLILQLKKNEISYMEAMDIKRQQMQ